MTKDFQTAVNTNYDLIRDMADTLFSLIIPIYNVPRNLLVGCLDSVVNQLAEHDDWECLLIDDGSTDGSGDVCDKYANNYNIFRVFHRNNLGNSFARNYGISQAIGKWILFLDDDDYLLDSYYENVFNAVTTYGSHFKNICFNHKRLNHDKNDVEYISVKKNAPIKEPKIYTVNNSSFNAHCVIWTHIYNRSLLIENSIEFPKTYTCPELHQYKDEDSYFNYLCFNYEELVLELPFYGIAHRIRKGSTNQYQMHKMNLPKGQYIADLYNDIMSRDTQNPQLLSYLSQKSKEFQIVIP